MKAWVCAYLAKLSSSMNILFDRLEDGAIALEEGTI